MFFVYILTNRKHGTLYTGVTGNVMSRLNLHREAADRNSYESIA
jgi:predicted GIY-YIG superfamily endonuclease